MRRHGRLPSLVLPGLVLAGLVLAGLLPLLILACGAADAQQMPTTEESVGRRLDRICNYLESGTPNQRAAAIRQLNEELREEHLDEYRSFFNRAFSPSTFLHLRRRYDALVTLLLDEAIDQLGACEGARRRLQGQLSQQRERTPTRAATQEELDEWASLRKTRDDARARTHAIFAALSRQGVAIGSALRHYDFQLEAPVPSIDKFLARLPTDVLTAARPQFARAPEKGTISQFDRRSLIPWIDALHDSDPEGWSRFREEVATDALAQFATYDPLETREARLVFLELGAWGEERLERWARDEQGEVPHSLRESLAAWNRLRVPPELTTEVAIPLGRYSALDADARRKWIHRLGEAGGISALPVLRRLLELEQEPILQLDVATELLRRHDPAGARFLQRLFYEGNEKFLENSRQLLLASALNRRNAGDLLGALAELERLASSHPGDFDIELELGLCHLLAEQYDPAIRRFLTALTLDPASDIAHYNLACAYALAGKPEEAMRSLRASIENGFRDADKLESDPDLASLRALDAFRELLEKLQPVK